MSFGHLDTGGLPSLCSYNEALGHFVATKPRRGGSDNVKPLDRDRKKTTTSIRQGKGDEILCRLHNTDCVTYHPDGRIVLDCGGWNSASTVAFINAVSPFWTMREKNRVWLKTTLQGDLYLLDVKPITVIGTTPQDPVQIYSYAVNRERAAAARATYSQAVQRFRATASAMTIQSVRVAFMIRPVEFNDVKGLLSFCGREGMTEATELAVFSLLMYMLRDRLPLKNDNGEEAVSSHYIQSTLVKFYDCVLEAHKCFDEKEEGVCISNAKIVHTKS